ncbi:spore germination protein GerPE [Brevibacillus ginsengisoli]|uniref:spore germination protein GerPE n=1 Tax=Brevibacillus ginsengisoli TaxID=363854 RepID=UPI003CF8FF71
MNGRISAVQHIRIISFDESSVFEIGDSVQLSPVAKVLTVQREKATFFDKEFSFEDYELYTEEIPQPRVDEYITIKTLNKLPQIRVNRMEIDNIAASSIIHVGLTEAITAEARVKNIRHLLREKNKRA